MRRPLHFRFSPLRTGRLGELENIIPYLASLIIRGPLLSMSSAVWHSSSSVSCSCQLITNSGEERLNKIFILTVKFEQI
jgi:hypothetical protein